MEQRDGRSRYQIPCQEQIGPGNGYLQNVVLGVHSITSPLITTVIAMELMPYFLRENTE